MDSAHPRPSSLLALPVAWGPSPALQAGRRRDSGARGPGLCAATQNFKCRRAAHGGKRGGGPHEPAVEGRHAHLRSFNQSPQRLRVQRTQWGEYAAHASGWLRAVWVDRVALSCRRRRINTQLIIDQRGGEVSRSSASCTSRVSPAQTTSSASQRWRA